MNWNIRLAYIQTIAQAIGFGIIQTAFSVYVTQGLEQSNLVLGNLFTISGMASTIFVFPSGYFADKYRRDLLIRVSVIFGLLSQFALIYSTSITDSRLALNLLFISQALGGLGWGLSGPAAQALIADSIEPGNRSKTFANMHFANLVAAAIGPFLAASLTIVLGDTWDISVLRWIILFGGIAAILANISVVFASDKKALVGKAKEITGTQISTDPIDYDWVIPGTIVLSGIIIGFGAGMTVAFFPVLFASPTIGYGLQPFFTYSLVGVTNIITGLAGLGAQRMISYVGRIGSMFLTQGLAIICLLGIVVNLVLFNSGLPYNFSVVLLAIFYTARNALMNASGPVSRSIVMDVVPSRARARWNSMETLAWGMFWSLSASIGGYIVDNFGFLYVFLTTATLYTIATLLLLTIKNRVPKESILTRSYKLGKLRARNRVVMPSIAITGLKAGENVSGQLTKEAVTFYADTAEGGAGLIYLEPAYIQPEGKSHAYQIGIHDDYVIPRLQEAVKAVHDNGALIGIRLAHAGVATSSSLTGSPPFGISEIKKRSVEPIHVLNEQELLKIQEAFLSAAIRAGKAGFDIVELSADLFPQALPDLISQILSSELNLRTDDYGGILKNRIRLVENLIKEIKTFIPRSMILSFYISFPAKELSGEITEFIKVFRSAGIDLLNLDFTEISETESLTSAIESLRTTLPDLPLVLSGDFDVKSAEKVLKRGQVELIGFGQLLQRDKSFPQALS